MSGFQFRKRFKIAPWITLNISKTGASVSVGPKGFRVTTGPRGTWFSMNLPGSGAYYRKKIGSGNEVEKLKPPDEQNDPKLQTLDFSPLQRLMKSSSEVHLVDALRAYYEGDEVLAYRNAAQAVSIADGAFLAGILALKQEDNENAVKYLLHARDHQDTLGTFFAAYELDLSIGLPITEHIVAEVDPDGRGVLLALAEAQQQLDLIELGIETLQALYRLDPEDLIVRLSLAELYDIQYPEAEQMQRQMVQLAENVHNTSPIHACLMYYRARALRRLGMYDGARDTLTKALRRKKDYPEDLLRALCYERACCYESLGKTKQAKTEFQKIFAEAPTYEDVAAKLGF